MDTVSRKVIKIIDDLSNVSSVFVKRRPRVTDDTSFYKIIDGRLPNMDATNN